MVGTTPGININNGRFNQGARQTESAVKHQISCPLGSVDACTAKAGDRFGNRVDPITGTPGTKHWGVDFVVPIGTPIYPAAEGEIIKVSQNGAGYGKYIVVRHTFLS